jgi:chromate transporter
MAGNNHGTAHAEGAENEIPFMQAVRLWWRIGWLSFGGPAGQIALMHRELVEQRRWISEPRFLHALNYCMLLPGPEAQQLAVYIGWLLHRTWGGIVAGALFVLPGALVLAGLSALYVGFGASPLATAIFFGLKAAILAIVVEAVLRIGRRALKSGFLLLVAASAFIAIYLFDLAFPLIVLTAAIAGLATARLRPEWLPARPPAELAGQADTVVDRMLERGHAAHTLPSAPRALRVAATCLLLWLAPLALAAALLGPQHTIVREGVFFSQAAVVTFGGAYAVLAYVAQRAVDDFGWLQPGEMVDGLALAETTPGPLVLVLQFVGFIAAYRHAAPLDPWLAASLGAAMTAWVLFLPSFLFILAGAPWIESLRRHEGLHAALTAVTAAVVGVILNLSIWFAVHTVFADAQRWRQGLFDVEIPVWASIEPGAAVLAAAAIVAVLRYRLPLAWTLLGSGLLGSTYWMLRYGP